MWRHQVLAPADSEPSLSLPRIIYPGTQRNDFVRGHFPSHPWISYVVFFSPLSIFFCLWSYTIIFTKLLGLEYSLSVLIIFTNKQEAFTVKNIEQKHYMQSEKLFTCYCNFDPDREQQS